MNTKKCIICLILVLSAVCLFSRCYTLLRPPAGPVLTGSDTTAVRDTVVVYHFYEPYSLRYYGMYPRWHHYYGTPWWSRDYYHHYHHDYWRDYRYDRTRTNRSSPSSPPTHTNTDRRRILRLRENPPPQNKCLPHF